MRLSILFAICAYALYVCWFKGNPVRSVLAWPAAAFCMMAAHSVAYVTGWMSLGPALAFAAYAYWRPSAARVAFLVFAVGVLLTDVVDSGGPRPWVNEQVQAFQRGYRDGQRGGSRSR